ncbi:hypothetical protein DFH07DRAFT_775559 [Mycena maculata]|uniref:Uncharacterized protein n=1 Tax=Mycena maculata TaxID=230809 RepID=A0AAD7IT00_9AGAR|nr:hypothetical protein DFH07DRAFT_775559 [Mycena maculata]
MITGKALNFKLFSKKSRLLGPLEDSKGAQAHALGDVIILCHLNLPEVDVMATVDAYSLHFILSLSHFEYTNMMPIFDSGVLALESHLDDYNLVQYLLSFPYLDSDAEITEYYMTCSASLNPKLTASNSLSHHFSVKDEQFFWDLTPRDTSPIEGWHAQDNQVNNTNRSLIEAIFLPWSNLAYGRMVAIQLKPDSPRRHCTCQARVRAKNAETANAEGGNKHLKARLAAAVQLTWSRDVEIQHLRSELNSRNLIGIPMQDSGAVPSTPQHKVPAVLPTTLIDISHSPDSGIAPGSSSPVASPSKLPTLLFSGILGIQRLFFPNDSDLDYVDALRSDRMNNVFEEMGCHAVNGNVESDVHPEFLRKSIAVLTYIYPMGGTIGAASEMPAHKKKRTNVSGLRNQGSNRSSPAVSAPFTAPPSPSLEPAEPLFGANPDQSDSKIATDDEEQCTMFDSFRNDWEAEERALTNSDIDSELGSDADWDMDEEEGLESMKALA